MRKLFLLVSLLSFGSTGIAAATDVFDNPPQPGAPSASPYSSDVAAEYFDDAHTIGVGPLRGFDVWLWNRADVGTAIDAKIRIYRGDPADGPPGELLAGPYAISAVNQPSVKFYHFDTPDSPMLDTTDLWFSVSFDYGVAGPVWNGRDPTIGVSHNILRYHDATVDFVDTGQSIAGGPANFRFAIYVDTAVRADPMTWGKIKALYRGDSSIQ